MLAMKKSGLVLAITASIFFISMLLSSCVQEETPTKTLMQGTWELTAAQDSSGNDILNKIAFPVTVIQLTDDNGMLGTMGPMFTRVVYGDSKWIEISAKIKQVFDYANLRFNTGEFFLDGGVQPRFTVEAKLQATAVLGGLKDILEIMKIGNAWIQQTIYHKFIGVKVNFSADKNTMYWEFDDQTTGAYNYKDAQGNPLLWQGWPVDRFQRGRYTWTKKTQTLNEVVSSYL